MLTWHRVCIILHMPAQTKLCQADAKTAQWLSGYLGNLLYGFVRICPHAIHAHFNASIFFVLITIITIYLPSSIYHHLSNIIYLPSSIYHHLSTIIYLPSSIYLSTSLSIYLSVCLSIYLSTYLSIYLSIYLPIYLSTYLSIYPSIYLSIYLSTCHYLSTFLPFCILIYHLWKISPRVSDPPATHGLIEGPRPHAMALHTAAPKQERSHLISSHPFGTIQHPSKLSSSAHASSPNVCNLWKLIQGSLTPRPPMD